MPIMISNSGSKLIVKRRLELPKVGDLPAEILESEVLNIDLGIKTTSAAGKEIVQNFNKIYGDLVESSLKSQQKDFVNTRQALASMLAKSEDRKRTEAFALSEQRKLVAAWNNFSKNGLKKRAHEALEKASSKVSKSAKSELDSMQIKINDISLKDNRVSFLSGVLAMAKGGAVAALGSSLLVSGLGIVAGLIGAGLASQQLIEKLWKQTSNNATELRTALAGARSNAQATSKLVDRVRVLQKSQRAEIAKEAIQRSKLQTELGKLKSAATKEKNADVGKLIKAVEARLIKSQKAMDLQKSALYDPTTIEQLVDKASTLLEKAEAEATKLAGAVETADKAAVFTIKDTETLAKSVQAFLKVLSKT